jgi:methylenetetrahydrofolate dehydrogenase (NADP+)/methenyltetrahydrofolate cyclohydrolase
MAANILSGKDLSAIIRSDLSQRIEQEKAKGLSPSLAVILVGEDPASASYVKAKGQACEQVGIISRDIRLDASVSQKELLDRIEELNNDTTVHGILVQLPLPGHIDEKAVIHHISVDKDVDGFHPESIGKMILGEPAFLPCTPHGVVEMLKAAKVETRGAEIVVLGRSNIVGRPLANMLSNRENNATVTICHTGTKNLADHCLRADILIAAAGKAEMVGADMVKPGAVVIDVGVNRLEDPTKKRGYRLCGDIKFDEVKEVASLISPVPGGVGPMTITMLLVNTFQAAINLNS